ncbi:MAG: hypothetical protein E4H13_12270 [Calditrichales bacterium]|nr:MAG: hypothetical protein E4H13_12270 [Calditrichales bacterium]
MKRKQFLTTGALVLIFFLMILLPVFAAGDVVIKGKLNNSGKGLLAGDGKQYTIIPSEDMEGQLFKHLGQQVELTGVAYVSHGRNMITAYSFKLSN